MGRVRRQEGMLKGDGGESVCCWEGTGRVREKGKGWGMLQGGDGKIEGRRKWWGYTIVQRKASGLASFYPTLRSQDTTRISIAST